MISKKISDRNITEEKPKRRRGRRNRKMKENGGENDK